MSEACRLILRLRTPSDGSEADMPALIAMSAMASNADVDQSASDVGSGQKQTLSHLVTDVRFGHI